MITVAEAAENRATEAWAIAKQLGETYTALGQAWGRAERAAALAQADASSAREAEEAALGIESN